MRQVSLNVTKQLPWSQPVSFGHCLSKAITVHGIWLMPSGNNGKIQPALARPLCRSGAIMTQSIQCAVRLELPGRVVHGTAWSIAGRRVVVTTRASVPPGSHAHLKMEITSGLNGETSAVLSDVIVREAPRTGDTRSGMRRYSVELRAMSYPHQLQLGRWLEQRGSPDDAGLEEPTDLLLGGTRSRQPPALERPTERTRVASSHTFARASTRQIRANRARVDFDAGSFRLQLTWRHLDDLHADWLSSLSHGVLYVSEPRLRVGDAVAIIAVLPDGRRALLSGRTSTSVRGVAVIGVSIGHAAHALLSPAPLARASVA